MMIDHEGACGLLGPGFVSSKNKMRNLTKSRIVVS